MTEESRTLTQNAAMNFNDYDLRTMQGCVDFMVDTDEIFGELSASVEAYDYLLKQAKAESFLQAAGSVAERDAKAILSDRYRELLSNLETVRTDYFIIKAKRATADMQTRLYQTKSANKRQGNL